MSAAKITGRTERQLEIVQKFADSKGKGTLLAATGFGKTYTAIMAIKGMVTRANIQSCLVVVPTIALKSQWEKELETHKVKFAEVLVINTAIKKQKEDEQNTKTDTGSEALGTK